MTFGICLLSLSLALGGCASKISGHRLEEVKSPIQKLNYVVLPMQINNPLLEYLKAPARDLTGLLALRVPQVFSMNGIETGHYGDSPYTIVIYPKKMIQYSDRGVLMPVQVQIISYIISTSSPSKKIWEGDATYVFSPNSLPNDISVDDLAKVVLEQLAKDGVVRVDAKELSAPTPNPQWHSDLLPDVQNIDIVPLPAPEKQRIAYQSYLTAATPKAFVICHDGRVMSFSGAGNFVEQKMSTLPAGCAPYAANDAVVWQ